MTNKCESTKRCIKGRNLCVNYQFKIRCKESGDLWRNKSCNINKCFHENESQNIKMHDLIKAKEDTGDKWRIQTSKNKQNGNPQLAHTRLSAVHGTLPHFAGARGNNAQLLTAASSTFGTVREPVSSECMDHVGTYGFKSSVRNDCAAPLNIS